MSQAELLFAGRTAEGQALLVLRSADGGTAVRLDGAWQRYEEDHAEPGVTRGDTPMGELAVVHGAAFLDDAACRSLDALLDALGEATEPAWEDVRRCLELWREPLLSDADVAARIDRGDVLDADRLVADAERVGGRDAKVLRLLARLAPEQRVAACARA
jgi:hypothetical protein